MGVLMPEDRMTATCKTCRWWGNLWPDDPDAVECCDHPKLNILETEDLNQLIMPKDNLMGNGEQGMTVTGPDFGCIHWEAKDDG